MTGPDAAGGAGPEPEHPGLRAVVFDWGDTLIRYPGFSTDEAGHRGAVLAWYRDLATGEQRACFVESGADGERFYAAYRAASIEQFALMAATGQDQPMALRVGATLAACGCRCQPDPEMLDRHLGLLLGALNAVSTPMAEAAAVLEALHGRFALGVVSNFPESGFVRATLARWGLDRFLDTVVVSADVGRMKPHPVPFEVAFERLGVQPAEVLFVGDDLRSDIAGAQALGCRTAWLPLDPAAVPTGPAHPDHRLRTLADLLGVVGRDGQQGSTPG